MMYIINKIILKRHKLIIFKESLASVFLSYLQIILIKLLIQLICIHKQNIPTNLSILNKIKMTKFQMLVSLLISINILLKKFPFQNILAIQHYLLSKKKLLLMPKYPQRKKLMARRSNFYVILLFYLFRWLEQSAPHYLYLVISKLISRHQLIITYCKKHSIK